MNKQLLEQFKRGEVILYTPKFEDFKVLMEWCDTQNIEWNIGEKATNNMMNAYIECNNEKLGIIYKGEGMFCIEGTFYNTDNKFNITASDLRPDKSTFTKDDLKIGMVAEIRNEGKLLISKNLLLPINVDFYLNINHYNLDLTNKVDDKYDIVKVYKTNNLIEVLEGKYDSLKLIWERDAIDWSNIPVDAKILVRDKNTEPWVKRHFAKYENNFVFYFNDGLTSFTGSYVSPCKYAKVVSK